MEVSEVLMPKHDLDLATVFETHDSFALTLAKSSLEDAGIGYLIEGVDPSYVAGIPGAMELAKFRCEHRILAESR
jgi:hypothetical protein